MKTLLLKKPKRTREGERFPTKRSTWFRALIGSFVVLFAVAVSQNSFGQGITGSITGTATDSSGASIPGATVTVRQIDTNSIRIVTTSDVGSYTVTQLAPGRYSVKVEKPGFEAFQQSTFTLAIDQVAKIDARLTIGSAQQTVTVTGEEPVIQTETSSVGLVVDSATIQNTPLNGHVSILGLINLVPGVQDVAAQDQVPVRGVTLAFGTNQRNSYGDAGFTFDGVTNMEVELQRGEGEVPPLDAISQFKVITQGAPAEFNQPNQVIVVSAGGGNALHGEVLEFNRSRGTGAKPYFFGAASAAPARPPYQRNEYSGNLSGPVYIPHLYNGKDRTFFFADYEGYREVFGSPIVSTVPTPAERAGNFQGIAANGIFDPLTTVPNPSGGANIRARFPNDTIPANRFDSIGVALANLYPLPQIDARVNNYTSTPIKRTNVHRGDARVDHQLSPTNALFFRYSVDWDQIEMPNTFNDAIGGNENSFAGPESVHSHNLVASWTRTFSHATVGDFRYGYTQYNMSLLTSSLTNPVWNTIPGRDTTTPYEPNAPIIGMSGYAGLGTARSEPLIRDEHMHQVIANISSLKGNHGLRFGTDLHFRGVSETASPPGESLFGRWNLDPSYTNNLAAPAGTGAAIASMILGYPLALRRDVFLPGTANLTTNEVDFYVKDDWRVSRTLTLNLGLHYEINTPFTEAHKYWASFNPATSQQLIAGQTGVSATANVNTDYKAIGPRLALAWQASAKTVIRAGYGLFYDPQGNAGTNIRQERQPPFDFVLNVAKSGNDVPSLFVSQGFPIVSTPPTLIQGPALYALKGITPDYRNAQVQQFKS